MPTTDHRAQDAAEYARMNPDAAAPRTQQQANAVLIRKIIWAAAFIGIGWVSFDGYVTFEMQAGAPQQAAVAAWGCFRIVAVYALARALDEIAQA